jgi:hypothetical protein
MGRKLILFAFVLLVLATDARATWTSVQVVQSPGGSCTSSPCAVTVASTGLGHLLTAKMSSDSGGNAITAVTSAACSSSWIHAPGLPVNGSGGSLDEYYCLKSASGQTSISVTVSGTIFIVDIVIEEAASSLGTIAVDSGATASGANADGACTSCAGISLTLSGNNDFVSVMAVANNTITGLTGTGFTYSATSNFGAGSGYGITTGSLTAPTTWTQNISGTLEAYAIAFQETATSCSASWCGIIDPTRAVNWSSAGAGAIPARSTICSTLTSSATSATINAAIAACPSGQTVLLSAGTYTITAGIDFAGHSNVTLRGSGPTQTILTFTGDTSCGGNGGDICAEPASPLYLGSAAVLPGGANAATWSGGYAQGATSITLTANAGLPAIGQAIVLDQLNDASDTTGVFICDVNPTCQLNGAGNTNGRVTTTTRSQQQIVTVTNIAGSTFTISPGLYANNWRTGSTPGAWWQTMVSGIGIENMTVDHTSSTVGQAGIFLYACTGCWVKNVKSISPKRNHVWIYLSNNDTVRDSYFYGTQNTSTQSYGVEPFEASDMLVENNIFQHIAAPILFTQGMGGAIGYNYATDNYYTGSSAWLLASLPSHGAGNQMSLMEGNEFNSIDCDDIWGSGATKTLFRNYLSGRGYNGTTLTTQNTNPIGLNAYCRGFNIIGNVLGTTSYHTIYESYTPNTVTAGNCEVSIYQLGYAATECGNNSAAGVSNDAVARNTLFRWGNYDSVNAAVQWNSSEVPTTGVTYISGNAVPASHTLPASFYLSAKPPWWGAMPWPPIGPDVSGGNIANVGGFAYLTPAARCYLSIMNGHTDGSSGVLAFDANSCYNTPGNAVSGRQSRL